MGARVGLSATLSLGVGKAPRIGREIERSHDSRIGRGGERARCTLGFASVSARRKARQLAEISVLYLGLFPSRLARRGSSASSTPDSLREGRAVNRDTATQVRSVEEKVRGGLSYRYTRSEKIWLGWGNCSILNQEIAGFLTQENICLSQENFLTFSCVKKIFDLSQENGYFLNQDTIFTSTHSYFFAPCMRHAFRSRSATIGHRRDVPTKK